MAASCAPCRHGQALEMTARAPPIAARRSALRSPRAGARRISRAPGRASRSSRDAASQRRRCRKSTTRRTQNKKAAAPAFAGVTTSLDTVSSFSLQPELRANVNFVIPIPFCSRVSDRTRIVSCSDGLGFASGPVYLRPRHVEMERQIEIAFIRVRIAARDQDQPRERLSGTGTTV